MTHAYATGWRGPASGRGRLVAALLVVALFFCHGAFGALHQVSSWPVEISGGSHVAATAPASVDHQTGHQNQAAPPALLDHQAGQHGGAVAYAGYAAVLFVVLLGAAALALFFVWSVARGPVVDARPPGRVPALLYLRPPRGPTPPLLQVFRL